MSIDMKAYIRQEWYRRAVAEYSSAAITAQVVHAMILCTLPEHIVLMGLRIVGDELAHARLSQDVLQSIGGSMDEIPTQHLNTRAGYDGWNTLLDNILCSFCIGETLAVPLFEAMRKNASQPKVVSMLTRVLQDEAVHRAFAWTTLDALLEKDRLSVEKRIAQKIPGWLRQYKQAYSGGITVDDEARAFGLIDGEAYRNIVHRGIHESIIPRFFRRGIKLDSVIE